MAPDLSTYGNLKEHHDTAIGALQDRISVLERALALYAQSSSWGEMMPDDEHITIFYEEFEPPWLPAMLVLNPDGQFTVEPADDLPGWYHLKFHGSSIGFGHPPDIERKQREVQALLARLRGPRGGEGSNG